MTPVVGELVRIPAFKSIELAAIVSSAMTRRKPGAPVFDLTLPMLPPSVNRWKRPVIRNGKQTMVLEAEVREFHRLIGQLAFGKRVPDGTPLCLCVELLSPKWLTVKGFLAHSRGDIDNRLKALIDALAKALHFNDARILQLHVAKAPARQPGTHAVLFEAPWMLESPTWRPATDPA